MTYDDLTRRLNETADAFSMSTQLPGHLRRRIALRRFVAAGTLGLLLVGAGAGAVLAISAFGQTRSVESAAPAPSSDPSREPSGWVVHYDSRHRYSIGYPTTWRRAKESLTPLLGEPLEVFSAGTFEPTYREGECQHLPSSALDDVGPTDAFVTIQEGGARDLEAYHPRPDDFEEEAKPVEGFMCTPADLEIYWLNFRDAGRAFYALVSLGEAVTPETRSQAWAVLNSFEPEAAEA